MYHVVEAAMAVLVQAADAVSGQTRARLRPLKHMLRDYRNSKKLQILYLKLKNPMPSRPDVKFASWLNLKWLMMTL